MLLFRLALPCSSPRRDGFSNHQYPRPFSCLGSNRRYSKWSKFNAQKSVDKSAVLEAVFKRNTCPTPSGLGVRAQYDCEVCGAFLFPLP